MDKAYPSVPHDPTPPLHEERSYIHPNSAWMMLQGSWHTSGKRRAACVSQTAPYRCTGTQQRCDSR